MSESADDKTEEPTAKRIQDALAKGQTPMSREPAVLASLLVFAGWLAFRADGFVADAAQLMRGVWAEAGVASLGGGDVTVLATRLLGRIGLALAPLLALLMAGGVVAGLVQAEPRAVGERIRPQASRISPLKGWSRTFGKRGWVEFGKALVKIGVAGTVTALVLRGALPDVADAMLRPPSLFLQTTAGLALGLVVSVALVMVAVTVFDVFWSRRTWREGLRMTRKETSDETKQAEGDPILKTRRRSLARDRSRRRMMEAVPGATLVIANPTHVAVALRYRHDEDAAPMVVAKGGDHLCLRIRELAEASGVPVFERMDLARALYKVGEVDRPIPETFYRAVAELVNFVMDPARAR